VKGWSCTFCKHKTPGETTCAAFPQGIPAAIIAGDDQHLEPYPGDGGIRYEASPKAVVLGFDLRAPEPAFA
jgi:hypothetical protein